MSPPPPPEQGHLRVVGEEEAKRAELVVLNSVSGEVVAPLDVYLGSYENSIRHLKGKITKLEADEEAEAAEHESYFEASSLYEWWQLAAGHEGMRFSAEDFYAILPRLREGRTGIDVLRALAGIVYDPNRKAVKNGSVEIYDGWHLLGGSKEKFKRYSDRAPGMPHDDLKWRRWLVSRIESRFKTKETK